jgi:hypothetical protein
MVSMVDELPEGTKHGSCTIFFSMIFFFDMCRKLKILRMDFNSKCMCLFMVEHDNS